MLDSVRALLRTLCAGNPPGRTRDRRGRERATPARFDLWLCDLERSEHRLLHGGGAWYQPASGFSPGGRFVSAGSAIVIIENRDGASALWLYDTRTGERGGDISLREPGVAHAWFLEPPIVSTDGARLYYTLTTPRLAGDVYAHDLRGGGSRRLTHSRTEVASEALVAPEFDPAIQALVAAGYAVVVPNVRGSTGYGRR